VFGYEALVRSRESTLPTPGDLFDAAERLDRVYDIGRAVRARVAMQCESAPAGARLFVNLHPEDLADDELLLPTSPLSRVAERVVLEITERAALDKVHDVRGRVGRLRKMGFRIAIDDLGAGYAGLTSFAQLEPEVVKLDMSLIRGVDADATRAKLVRSMTALCKELDMQVISEGIETVAERDTIAEIGCDLLQGYLFAKPGDGFATPSWG
jgi:EAL domain-containing protein (putative c-di-GMP-specific phosphodiesterase class I)